MHARTHAFSSLKGATLSASPTNWHCSSILLGYLGEPYKGQIHKPANTTKNDLQNPAAGRQAFQSLTGLSKRLAKREQDESSSFR